MSNESAVRDRFDRWERVGLKANTTGSQAAWGRATSGTTKQAIAR